MAAVIAVAVGSWFLRDAHLRTSNNEFDATVAAPRVAPSAGGSVARPDKFSISKSTANGPNWVSTTGTQPATALALTLPPIDTPIADVVRQLKAAAEAGNPQAACRLGVELSRCWKVDEIARHNTWQKREADADPYAEWSAAEQKRCTGVDAAIRADAWRYLLQAAKAGNVAAMAQFAIAPPLSSDKFLVSLGGWQAVRENGAQFLLTAIDNGDVRALNLAFFASFTGLGSGGESVLPKDGYRAAVYAKTLLPLVDAASAERLNKALVMLDTELGAAKMGEADTEAARLRQHSFSRVSEPIDTHSDVGQIDPLRCALN